MSRGNIRDTLYKLLEENRVDLMRADEIQKEKDAKDYDPYPNGWNRADFYKDFFNDDRIDGHIMTYPHGRVIRQAQSSSYWRGENQVHAISQASLYRHLRTCRNHEHLMVENFVAYMRIGLFLDLLLRFDHVRRFVQEEMIVNGKNIGGLDLLFIPLAQHYGLNTALLDITSDLEIALFFACCTTTDTPNEWRPLNKSDFKKDHEKYGVLFRKHNYLNPSPFLYHNSVEILPIGFQPFMRCHMQRGYIAMMSPDMCLQKDVSLRYLKFPHDEKFCREIFERMDRGKKIYPHEGLNIMHDEIAHIKGMSCFPYEVFEFACDDMKFDNDRRGDMRIMLKRHGYAIGGDFRYIPAWKIREIDKLYADFDIERTYGIKLQTRLTYMSETGWGC